MEYEVNMIPFNLKEGSVKANQNGNFLVVFKDDSFDIIIRKNARQCSITDIGTQDLALQVNCQYHCEIDDDKMSELITHTAFANTTGLKFETGFPPGDGEAYIVAERTLKDFNMIVGNSSYSPFNWTVKHHAKIPEPDGYRHRIIGQQF